MKRTLSAVTCLLLLLAAHIPVQGQGRGRPWRRGPLSTEEFTTAMKAGNETSHLECAVVYNPAGVKEGIHTYRFCRTSAVMYPAASWMAEGHRDSSELEYNQTLFDLVEVYSRQMQREAVLLTKRMQYDHLLATTNDMLEREMQVVRLATDHGRDSAALERIRRRNREWLNSHSADRPAFEKRPFWWNVGMDFGGSIPTGGLARYYSGSVNAQGVDFSIGLKRHGLYWHHVAGSVHSADSVERWGYRMENFTRTDITIGYGYTVVDRDSYSITPYAALGFTDFIWWMGENYTVGVIGRYHFHHWHRITGKTGKNTARCVTASASARLYASYSDLGGDFRGVTLGLQLGINLTTRNERYVLK